ncbi:MAG: NifU family protein [Gordonia sp. (in: high G+C Gram-positive bacteria)]
MAIHLTVDPVDDAAPRLLRWHVAPGLQRLTGDVDAEHTPAPLRTLIDDGVLASIRLRPGVVETELSYGRSAAADGAAVRSALYLVFSAEGGWPSPDGGDAATVARAADAEIAEAVADVLDGEFGAYTASHGGAVELCGVHDGVVQVSMTGACRGCRAAQQTLAGDLALRLATVPGFAGVVDSGDARGGEMELT